ncbi:transcription regulator HTH, apses-type DNA-binding domain-containing protein [Parasitella parasitica]|nr:transcription regulator HTH, apses-type DNA-binding domain-containing protein [Parasitella parasitica]
MQRPKLTTTVWEDEGTVCYQVDAKSVCVARRQDNDMINGTKLLNVVGMSRGKRDGILKNEKGRVVVKVGAMHLKGVWITFTRAKDLATKFKIVDILYPLFVEDPSVFLSVPPPPPTSSVHVNGPVTGNSMNGNLPIMLPPSNPAAAASKYSNNFGSFNMQSWEKQPYQSLPSITNQQDQSTLLLILLYFWHMF